MEQPRDTPLVFEYEIVDSTHIVGFDLFYGTQALSELRIKHQVLDTAKGIKNAFTKFFSEIYE